MKNEKENRIGAIGKSCYGDAMQIVDYLDSNHIKVKFLDETGYTTDTTYAYFLRGTVRNPFRKSVCDIGVVGLIPTKENGRLTVEYKTWCNVLRRCKSNSGRRRDACYIGCDVCDEWLKLENFSKWLHDQSNFENWKSLSKRAIDKDIIRKHNDIYSPSTCFLVPSYINNLFTRRENDRGEYAIGVSFHKRDLCYTSNCHNPFTNSNVSLGYHDTELEAFCAYKEYKENVIKKCAELELGRGNISNECYEAMISYEVEFTD